MERLSKVATAMMCLVLSAGAWTSAAALPQQEAPAPHWPWWLRIIAVIGALAFVQIVARSMRRGAAGRGSDSSQNQ